MQGVKPSVRSLLEVLAKARLVQIGRDFSVGVSPSLTKEEQIKALLASRQLEFGTVLRAMGRDELKAACRAHGLEDAGRARQDLAKRLLDAWGEGEADAGELGSTFAGKDTSGETPATGDIVRVRHRQYLVEDVVPPPEPGHATLVKLVCLDDDAQGRELQILWELELGARVMQPQAEGLGNVLRIDPPRYFAAYLHALKWNAVTASDARLFQAPFRAGIQLLDHQLAPLKKALSLPRANLFIADDVGLGKTIEAGLVLQELLLRQQVVFVLIVCPAAICLQWRSEMDRRFGLQFEIYNRAFVARRRQERGFQVNPWATHNRFIISYQTLRRPEYRDPLIQHLGDRARKSLLVLDEAHTAAPSSATKYAIDSRITRVVRDIAPRFVNRLFLSATPHNGHSNSFSALLEILDPQRFTRGVPVTSTSQLEPVMVRRLKSDLRAIGVGVESFPEREVVQVDLIHEDGSWRCRYPDKQEHDLGTGPATELELSEMLAEYTTLMKPQKGRGQLVFINLQKRLLSSLEAFWRTLKLHADSVGRGRAAVQLDLSSRRKAADEEEYGIDEDSETALDAAETEGSSGLLTSPEGRAQELLSNMLGLAEQGRHQPDAKVLALLDWIRRHQCPAVVVGGPAAGTKKQDLRWSDRRLIVFTEYADTKRFLFQVLSTAVAGTEDDHLRLMHFHGGMSDDQREEVQTAFNGPPDEHPVRILIATDAAREGVNLQGHCADLFHFDVPWNPARMEQRNGRIDRTLQSEKTVRCHYFFYPARKEDRVLRTLVDKVERIQRELGSLGAVVMDRLERALEKGIDATAADRLEAAAEIREREQTAAEELETQRRDRDRLRKEIDDAGKILNRSREILEFDPALLRDALDVGFELADLPHLQRVEHPESQDSSLGAFRVSELTPSWQHTLDKLRPPRRRDEPPWEWRKRPTLPVVFKPPKRLNTAVVQLHLQHSLVQRVLGRFLAQGYSTHDLSRVTIVRNPHDSLVRAIAFGRLSLFGKGAVRLHDQLVSVAAQWLESGGDSHLRPFAEAADRKAIERLEELFSASPTLEHVPESVQTRLLATAATDFATLWPHIRDEADHLAHEAERALTARGSEEAEALRGILDGQRHAILSTLEQSRQGLLQFTEKEATQKDQFEEDRKHMERRLQAIEQEMATEPPQIEELYQVALRRLEPVGLVYLWPETRG